MNKTAQTIKNRLSLRAPQAISLEILSKLAEELELKNAVDVVAELAKVKALYPTCTDFERNFPSITFALATGVGKTRLMGAFIAYLYIEKGIKNFFVLAPGTTIYNKLIDDLSNPSSSKYVFHGISEFAVNRPRIITGDNYNEARTDTLFGDLVKINIFNIQKITSEMRGGREPRIKRLSEYIGDSYFNYLAELDDLVVLMDESHHYRAAAGMQAINELRPILGLELTATPKVANAGNARFKNVVYEYSLAKAMDDGFVKDPAVATRRNFNPLQYHSDPKGLELLKLEDGIRFHEDTKVALDVYSRNTGNKLVKPFVLVVTKNTDHAGWVHQLIESEQFFGGRYKGKVITVHSNQTGSESEDNIQKLLGLESPENTVEIVIHVNMLKEGWDVTNLYTIVPLRSANAEILVEQTIGRGLRLPYGVRTGVKKVDTLTIISHDSFQAIVDAANDPNSIIRKENIIEIDPEDIPEMQEVVSVQSGMDATFVVRQKEIDAMTDESEKKIATIDIEAQQEIVKAAKELNTEVKDISDLKTEEIRAVVLEKVKQRLASNPQGSLFAEDVLTRASDVYGEVIDTLLTRVIPIPRIVIQQRGEVYPNFDSFDLDVTALNFQPVSEDMVRHSLRTNERETVSLAHGEVVRDTPVNMIINELVNYPTVDYDRHSDLLHKLATQAVTKLDTGNEGELRNIVIYYKKNIAGFIYAQMEQHFELIGSEYDAPVVRPYSSIEPHNYTKGTTDQIHGYTETIDPVRDIPKKLFGGFKKACHDLYKFDSKAEKDFANILEGDAEVVRWLRPSLSQFSMYWSNNTKRYIPDFIVETKNNIYMVEIKAEVQMNAAEVVDKAAAAVKYCKTASDYNIQNGGKPWKYLLIPHNQVTLNRSLESFTTEFPYSS